MTEENWSLKGKRFDILDANEEYPQDRKYSNTGGMYAYEDIEILYQKLIEMLEKRTKVIYIHKTMMNTTGLREEVNKLFGVEE